MAMLAPREMRAFAGGINRFPEMNDAHLGRADGPRGGASPGSNDRCDPSVRILRKVVRVDRISARRIPAADIGPRRGMRSRSTPA
jgi:hypothetical protein